uniref:Altered inheritance of mitochondria protein 23, mitochondrial n=1 Tax=Lygus hesperus TaxID=30085 RepID=A0A0A9WGM4_LYGHE
MTNRVSLRTRKREARREQRGCRDGKTNSHCQRGQETMKNWHMSANEFLHESTNLIRFPLGFHSGKLIFPHSSEGTNKFSRGTRREEEGNGNGHQQTSRPRKFQRGGTSNIITAHCRQQSWLRFINVPELKDKTLQTILNTVRVCSIHFKYPDFKVLGPKI